MNSKSTSDEYMSEDHSTREASEFLAQIADDLVSATTDVKLLEKVPFVSYIAKAFALKDEFHRQRLARNCQAFMDAAREGNLTNLAGRLRERVNDPKRLWELEDTTLHLLIEAEQPMTAEILGRLLRALADGRLSFEQFDSLSLLLISASVPALRAIPTFFKNSGEKTMLHGDTRDFEPLLLSLGVASRYGSKLEVNELGQLLNPIGFSCSAKA